MRQCQQEMGKIPKYTDSERLMTPKTDYLLTDYKGEESIIMDFQVCQPQKNRVLCNLKDYLCYSYSYINKYPVMMINMSPLT